MVNRLWLIHSIDIEFSERKMPPKEKSESIGQKKCFDLMQAQIITGNRILIQNKKNSYEKNRLGVS